MKAEELRDIWERHWKLVGADEDAVHEIYHEDAVLEFPQSGERFEGRATFQAWREKYPAKVTIEMTRLSGSDDFWVAEGLIRYDDGEPSNVVNLLTFRGDKIAHERIYVAAPFEAPTWRKPYASKTR